MKKALILCILLTIFGLNVFSQDKIVTLNHDTIDCRINKVSHNTIYFDVITKGVRSSGKLPLTSVLNYTISGNHRIQNDKITRGDPFERLRIGIGGGFGYLLASSEKSEELMVNMGLTADQAESYYKNLKTGIYGDADLTYLFNPDYGAGIKYKFFETTASLEGFFDPFDGVNLIYSTYKEQIYVNYVGASFYYQQFIGRNKSFRLNSEVSFGMVNYRDEAEYINSYYLLTGKNIGMDTGLGLEYFLAKNLSAGANLSLFYSTIRKFKMTDGTNTVTIELDKDNYENLSRIELSFGIRFYFLRK
jgi:hypothetical protein